MRLDVVPAAESAEVSADEMFPPVGRAVDRRRRNRNLEILSRGIAFVPFCPLGWPRGKDNPVLTETRTRPYSQLASASPPRSHSSGCSGSPNVLLIAGTGSAAHLRENLDAERVTFDDEALRDLDGVTI